MNRTNHSGITRALGALRLTSRPCSQSAAEDGDVLPPFRIHRTSTSVLEAIASTIRRPPGFHPDIHPVDPFFFKNARTDLFHHTLAHKLRGRQSARYLINNSIAGDIVPLRTEQPRIPAFDPRMTASQVAEMPPSEDTLVRLIAMGNASSAWKMYNDLGAEAVSSETRLKLLDLLCAYNSRSRSLTETDQLEMFIERRQQAVTLPSRPVQKQRFSTWASGGLAERLFTTLSEEEKNPGYRAMIRGFARYGAYEQAFKMHREMISAGYSGDLKSYNAVLMCVHTVTPFTWKKGNKFMSFHPWRAGLDLFYEMRNAGVSPNVESFNSLIFSIAFSFKSKKMKAMAACKSVMSLLKEMEALDMPPNLGTLTNVLRLADHVVDAEAWHPISEVQSEQSEDRSPKESLGKLDGTDVKSAVSEILDFLIEELSKDKGRKRFGSEFDMEILHLINNAKFCHTNPLELSLKFHYLLRDSPGLAVRQSRWNTYLGRLLSYLCEHDPHSAVDILEEEVNFVIHFRLSDKIKYLNVYAKTHPERMHNFLKTIVHETPIQMDFVGFRNLFAIFFTVVDSYPSCKSSVIEALDALWTRVSRDWQIFDLLTGRFYSNFLFILLPSNVDSEVEASALDLGIKVYNASKNTEKIFGPAHRVLHLVHALLKAGRSAEGISILQTMFSKQRPLCNETNDHFDYLVDKIAEFPEVMADEQLSLSLAEHKDSKHLYYVTSMEEMLLDKDVVEKILEEAEESSRPFNRTPDNRADQRTTGRARKPWHNVPEEERSEFKKPSPRRDFRGRKSNYYLGFPTKRKPQGRNQKEMLPKLKTDESVTDIGSEETWPDLKEDTSSSSSSSSDDEL